MSCCLLLSLCEDLLHSVSLFLSAQELGTLSCAHRYFSGKCFGEDRYWLLRFSSLHAAVQTSPRADALFSAEHLQEVTTGLRAVLHTPSYLQLYQSLYPFGCPLFGLWCREPRDIGSDFRGGLYRIRADSSSGDDEGTVVAEALSPAGDVVFPMFKVIYCPPASRKDMSAGGKGRHCRGELTAVNLFDESKYAVSWQAPNRLCFGATQGSSAPSINFVSLNCMYPNFSQVIESPTQLFPGNLTIGLYRALYGSHGHETLHLRASFKKFSERNSSMTGIYIIELLAQDDL